MCYAINREIREQSPDLVCYDGSWYVYKLGGNIGSLASVEATTGLLPR